MLEAAKQTKGIVKYRMVGPIGVTPQAEAALRQHVELTGPVSAITNHRALPLGGYFSPALLCEGSANATYEALATGLPVICTPNAGSVVRDGINGYIVPPRSAEVYAERIESLRQDPITLRALSHNAAAVAVQSESNGYSRRLLEAITKAGNTDALSPQRAPISYMN